MARITGLFALALWMAIPSTSFAGLDDDAAAKPEVAPIFLAKDGTALAVILVPERPSIVEAYAAGQLAHYLSRMTGGTFRIVEEKAGLKRTPAEPVVSIGRTSLARGLSMDGPQWKRTNGEAFRIVRRHGTLLICGNQAGPLCDSGTLWGVYAFLQSQGVGIYLPDALGEVVPKKPTLSVSEVDLTDAPAFEMRGGAETPRETLRRLQANGNQSAVPHLLAFGRQASARGCEFNHAYQYIATPKVRKEHPDWFRGTHNSPYPGGDPGPSPHIGHGLADNGICLSRPEIRKLFSDYFRTRFRDNPDLHAATVAPDDFNLGYRCGCADCKRLLEKSGPASFRQQPRSASDLHIDFVNAVAAGLEHDFPDRKLITLAYNDYLDAPSQTRIHPNVVIMFAPLVSGTNELNPALDPIVRKWKAMGARKMYWYGYLLTRPPVPHLMGEWFRNYQRLGMAGVYLEYAEVPAMNVLNGWLYAKLTWNPRADVNTLIEEYCAGLFGPEIGPLMRRFFLAAWEVHPPLHAEIPELFAAARAMAGAPPSPLAKRVRFFELGWELYDSSLRLDAALKAADIPTAYRAVQSGLGAAKALKSEYPWAIRTNLWLHNTALAEYSVSVLPALETLLKSPLPRHDREAAVPGPNLCLTNNTDLPAHERVDAGTTVTFEPPSSGGLDGKKLFDGNIKGAEHNLTHGSTYPLWIINLDLQKEYQLERVELATGMTSARWDIVPMYIDIEVSSDGKVFRPVERILPRTLKGFVSSGTLLTTARHVRLRLASLNMWHAVSEVRLWGRAKR